MVHFSGNGTDAKGSGPYAGLVRSSDGSFYGTTTGGGANGYGTVFKMTPAGALTTLVEFTGTGDLTRGDFQSPVWCRAVTAISMGRPMEAEPRTMERYSR